MKKWEHIEEKLESMYYVPYIIIIFLLLIVELSDDIRLAKQQVDQKLASLAEIQKEKVSKVFYSV